MDTQGWFRLGLTSLISLQPKGLSRGILMRIFPISFGVYMYGFMQIIGIIVSFILLNTNFVLKLNFHEIKSFSLVVLGTLTTYFVQHIVKSA